MNARSHPTNAVKIHSFLSGTYTGFFNYRAGGEPFPMNLTLSFSGGRVAGHGQDQYGPFIILGSFDSAAGECQWTKTYSPERMVTYRGFSEADGVWGTWEIEGVRGGGFQIQRNKQARPTREPSAVRPRRSFDRQ